MLDMKRLLDMKQCASSPLLPVQLQGGRSARVRSSPQCP
jgi:hypothetical protein